MRLTDNKMRQQKTNETREQYVTAARKYAKQKFNDLRDRLDYKWAHESHAVLTALRLTEKRFVDLGTFGVEGDCVGNGQKRIDIQYLNAGDTYETTIIFYRGQFRVGCVGDILEKQL